MQEMRRICRRSWACALLLFAAMRYYYVMCMAMTAKWNPLGVNEVQCQVCRPLMQDNLLAYMHEVGQCLVAYEQGTSRWFVFWAGALEKAFMKCSSLLVTLVDSRSCVTGSTYQLLDDMAAALTCLPWSQFLARLDTSLASVAWQILGSALQHIKFGATHEIMRLRCDLPCSPWLGAVHELERLFNDADQASAALLSSQIPSAAGQSSADNAPASLFDDDLDLQATTVAAATGR